MEIEKITLLTKDEYKKYKCIIPLIKDLWWLRSPGSDNNRVCSVNYEGCVYSSGSDITHNIGVRPVLIIRLPLNDTRCFYKPEKLIGTSVKYGDYTWTVLKAEAGVLQVICDQLIVNRRFDPRSNEWCVSELKRWLEHECLHTFPTTINFETRP